MTGYLMKYNEKEKDALLGLISLLRDNKKRNKNHMIKSKKQTKALYYVFKKNMYPPSEFRYDLSVLFDYSPRTIQIWFQNKRQAYKLSKKSMKKMFYYGDEVDLNDVLDFFVYMK